MKKVYISPDAVEDIRSAVASYRLQSAVFKEVCLVLKSFDGKKVTKAFETKIMKECPNIVASYHNDNWWSKLNVWGGKINYDKRLSLVLAYNTPPQSSVFDFAQFMDSNRGYDRADWADALEARISEVEGLSRKYQEASEALEAVAESLGNLRHYVVAK